MKQHLIILLFFICGFTFSQSPQEELNEAIAQHKGAGMVFTKRIEKYTINIINDTLQVYAQTDEEILILTDEYASQNEKELSYSSFSKYENIKASTLVPSKKKYKEIVVKDFKEKDVLSNSVFHDDVKEISFIYPSLSKGAKKTLSYKELLNEPRFLGGFFIASYLPTEYAEFSIDYDSRVDLEISEFNTDDLKIKAKKTVSNGRTTIKYSFKNTPEIKVESSAPNVRYYAPHLHTRIKSYTIHGTKKNLLNDPTDLHNWYADLLEKIDDGDNAKLTAIADSVAKPFTTDIDKVKAIFQWVQSNIKYVAFEDGLGGFVPRSASRVCDKRFGDCKDMANITITMLNAVGIDAHIVWIGSDDIPYTYNEVPTPSVDNHMIACYKHNNEYLFLDATSSFTPFGMPSSFIQGKEAMIHIDHDNFELVKVPVVSPLTNSLIDTNHLSLTGRDIKGNGNLNIGGYYKETLTEKIRRTNNEDKAEYYKKYLEKGSNKFLVKDFKEQNVLNRDPRASIRYNYGITDYATINDDEIYINLNLDKTYQNSEVNPERTIPLMYRYASYLNYVNILDLPEGYKVNYLPEDVHFKNDKFSVDITYKEINGQVIYSYSLTRDFRFLYEEDFKVWNAFITQLREAYSEAIILKKK